MNLEQKISAKVAQVRDGKDLLERLTIERQGYVGRATVAEYNAQLKEVAAVLTVDVKELNELVAQRTRWVCWAWVKRNLFFILLGLLIGAAVVSQK